MMKSVAFPRSRSLGALATAGLLLAAPAALAGDMSAEIAELKRRLAALEAQQAKAEAQKPAAAMGKEAKLGDTQLNWGGYVKFDLLYSRFSEGEVAQGSARDFYLPNGIPVSAGSGSAHDVLDFHAKETRLFVKTETPIEGHKLGTYIEFDFISSQGAGNEVVTNAYNPAFRRGFITWDKLLVGQDWTTFLNLASLPETLDFVAFPSDGTVFGRQPQLRYTIGGLQLALENNETTVLPGGGGAVTTAGDGVLPDLVARYNFRFSGGSEMSLAALARQLRVENAAVGGATPVAAVESEATGLGASFAGKIVLGKDDLKFQVTAGQGIGRYVALGSSADAVLFGGELEPIDLVAGYLAYKHQWSQRWRSTFTASTLRVDNDTAMTGSALTADVLSFSGNLLYSPAPRLTFGVELRHAERELENGQDGDLNRLQWSAKYLF